MAVFTARHSNARIAPRKARLSADLIRGRKVSEALNILNFEPRRGSAFLRKVLLSAVANAQERGGVDPMDLTVVKACIDKGIYLKRFRPVSRGRAHPILKRCCHITVQVATGE